MRLLLAEEMGMCFGVRDALELMDQVEHPEQVQIHGELVHNPVVLQQLDRRGFSQVAETERSAESERPVVLITAHGISNRERNRLEMLGKTLVDTTCPLVRRVHEKALALQQAGYFIVLFGKAGHVEVRGIVEDLHHFQVIETEAEIRTLTVTRVALICQTTMAPDRLAALRQAFEQANPQPEIRFVDTSCRPTRDRQTALENLLTQVDRMIVVGGRNSNNTRELTRKCLERGIPAYQVEQADELQSHWFDGASTVGLTAGTSTLPETIDEVRTWIEMNILAWESERITAPFLESH